MLITESMIRAIAPKSKAEIVSGIVPALNAELPKIGVTTPLRLAHFIAQAAHETAGFKTLTEYWGPTPAQKRYEGRADLGNVKRGDGKRYMGRGIFQITGRANYKTIGAKLGLDLEGNPALAADPEVSVKTACEYWRSRGMNRLADADDMRAVTKRINGGYNGLADREAYLAKAKATLKSKPVQPIPAPRPANDVPVLDFTPVATHKPLSWGARMKAWLQRFK
jgi:putative chitinase